MIKIALTGGPGAGKTTILQDFTKYLEENNIPKIVLNETASEINQGVGIPIQLRDSGNVYEFQEMIYKIQQLKEYVAKLGAKYIGKDNMVELCDRGIPDNRAYLYDQEFDALAASFGTNLLNLCNDYDFVIDLTSAAALDEGYTTENNPTRKENKEVAAWLDERTLESWALAKNLVVIQANKDFNEKRKQALEIFKKILNGEMIRSSLRFDATDVDLDYLKKDCTVFDVNITEYIYPEECPLIKKFYEDIEYKGNHEYYYNDEFVYPKYNQINKCIRVNEGFINEALNNDNNYQVLKRREERFVKNGALYIIKYFDNKKYLEIQPKYNLTPAIEKDVEGLNEIYNFDYHTDLHNIIENGKENPILTKKKKM